MIPVPQRPRRTLTDREFNWAVVAVGVVSAVAMIALCMVMSNVLTGSNYREHPSAPSEGIRS